MTFKRCIIRPAFTGLCAIALVGGALQPAAAAARFLKDFSYVSHTAAGNEITFTTSGAPKVKIYLCLTDVARVWMEPSGTFQKDPSYAAVTDTWPAVTSTITDKGTYIGITTSDLSIHVNKNPFLVSFYSADDSKLIADERASGGMGWDDAATKVFSYWNLGASEHFYGLGMDNAVKEAPLDRRGYSFNMWADMIGWDVSTGRAAADVPIPFFTSTGSNGGYGMFFDNTGSAVFDMGAESGQYYYWRSEIGECLFYFFNGPSFKKIIDKYTQVTGRPIMPPSWAISYWQSRCNFNSLDEISNFLTTMRNKKIPVDAVMQDLNWSDCVIDFKWGNVYKNAPTRLADFEKRGLKVIISINPMIKPSCCNYQDGITNNVYATDGNGKLITAGYYGGTLLDWTQPKTADWVWNQMKPLYDDGVDGWRLDLVEPEHEPANTVYYAGPRSKMHNVYGIIEEKILFEKTMGYDPNCRVFMSTRNTSAGGQRYGVEIWSGDIIADYATYRAQVPQGLNLSMSGIPYWTSDAGGFGGLYKNSTNDHGLLFERWVSTALFWPVCRPHHVSPACGECFPYSFGASVEATIKKYITLRYRLMPYIYSSAWETHTTGAPLTRPLVFEYQNDAQVYNLKDEWMLGSNLLVAPVFVEGATSRPVYFPAGKWIDYDTHQEHTGPTTATIAADHAKVPLFVKAGAIIPMAPDMQYTREKTWDPITFDVYPSGTSSFQLFQDDLSTLKYQSQNAYKLTDVSCIETPGQRVLITVTQSNKNFSPAAYAFTVHINQSPIQVIQNGQILTQQTSETAYTAATAGWWWDNANKIVNAKFPTATPTTYQLSVNWTLSEAFGGGEAAFFPLQAFFDRDQLVILNAANRCSVDFLDILGRTLRHTSLSGGRGTYRVPVTTLAKGIYLARVTAANGSLIQKLRILE